MRLNKYMADHGIASRRACDELIAKGKVSVGGEVVTELGTKVDPSRDEVEVDGVHLRPTRSRYYLLNKPRGVVCTNELRESRPRAVDLVTDPAAGRIYTVGRLDEDSTGLILLTNDGEFTQLVSHPRHGIQKTYMVKVRGRAEPEALEKIRGGVQLAEGRTGRALVRVLKRTSQFTLLSVTLHEGKNREVRRLFAKVGLNVLTLRRTRIGNLQDRRLKEGQWRPLRRFEVEELMELARSSEGAAPAPERPLDRNPAHRKKKAADTRAGDKRKRGKPKPVRPEGKAGGAAMGAVPGRSDRGVLRRKQKQKQKRKKR